MSNSNTIDSALLQGNPAKTPSTLVNAGDTNPRLFTYTPAAAQANDNPGTALPVVLSVPTYYSQNYSTGANVASGIGAGANSEGTIDGTTQASEEWAADGNPFLIRAFGKVAPLQTGRTLKVAIWLGNGLGTGAPGAFPNVQLCQFSQTMAVVSAAVLQNWYVEVKCMWDAASNVLNAVANCQIAGQPGTQQNGSFSLNSLAGLSNASLINSLPFTIGATMNDVAQAAANFTISLTEFSAERL